MPSYVYIYTHTHTAAATAAARIHATVHISFEYAYTQLGRRSRAIHVAVPVLANELCIICDNVAAMDLH